MEVGSWKLEVRSPKMEVGSTVANPVSTGQTVDHIPHVLGDWCRCDLGYLRLWKLLFSLFLLYEG